MNKEDIEDDPIFAKLTFLEPKPNFKLKPRRFGIGVFIKHRPKEGDDRFDADRSSYKPLIEVLFSEVNRIVDTIDSLP